MSALKSADAAKLANVLGRLGSEFAGERDAAALAATRMLATLGLQWIDILASSKPEERPAVSPRSAVETVVSARRTAARLLRQRELLADREAEFLASLMQGPPRKPSEKQAARLAGIASRVDAAVGGVP